MRASHLIDYFCEMRSSLGSSTSTALSYGLNCNRATLIIKSVLQCSNKSRKLTESEPMQRSWVNVDQRPKLYQFDSTVLFPPSISPIFHIFTKEWLIVHMKKFEQNLYYLKQSLDV